MKMQLTVILFLLISFASFSQNDTLTPLIKKGWNFGALPTITFDTDLGFQYGVLVNLYNYGDGSRYPTYDHSLYFEISHFTKGSGIARFYYDSDRLVKGLQTSMDLSYLTDQAYDFYGFNGYDAVFNKYWIDDQSNAYITRMFYKYDRKLFRWKVDVQGKITGNSFRWIAGVNLLNYEVGPVNLEKLNKGKSGNDLLPDVDGLYQYYQDWGIISDKEADGGFVPTFKAGLVLDTRDNKPNPMHGVWTEAVLVVSPDILGAEGAFSKLSLVHREYFTLLPKTLSFVYRIAYQSTLGGDVPFYYQTHVVTSVLTGASSEGLGGAATLRGVKRNRVVGDGFLLGNVELRWTFHRFQLMNNNFYMGLNGALDFGQVTNKIPIDVDNATAFPGGQSFSDYFDPGAEKMHLSYGAGFHVAMNENFVITADFGLAADKRDGNSGLYIGLNYLF